MTRIGDIEIVKPGSSEETVLLRELTLRRENWWRPIPRTPTTETYVAGQASLNIPYEGHNGDWGSLLWGMRLVENGVPVEEANTTTMGSAQQWPYWDATSLRDAREGLLAIGHPAGQRAEPIYAARFARTVAERIVGPATENAPEIFYPCIRDVRSWLRHPDETALFHALLDRAGEKLPHIREITERWINSTRITQ